MYVGTNKFFCFYLYYFDHFTFIFIIFFYFTHIYLLYIAFSIPVCILKVLIHIFSHSLNSNMPLDVFFLFEQCIIQYSLICKHLEIYLLYFCYFRLSPLFSFLFFHCFQRTYIYGFFP